MSDIISGASLSTYKTVAISIGQSKKENRNGVKSKFAILTLKDEGSMLSKATRFILFEEELFEGAIDTLKNYAVTNDNGDKVKDARGGYAINLKALKESDDYEDFKGLMRIEGGMVMDYNLKKGLCYANDVDGKRVVNGRNENVMKSTISVFVQVKHLMPTENGGMRPVFYAGMGLEERGSRMEDQFYREAVKAVASAPQDVAAGGEDQDEKDPF